MSQGERHEHILASSVDHSGFQSSNKSSKSSSPQSSFPALSAFKRVAPSPADCLDRAATLDFVLALPADAEEKPKSSKKSSAWTACFFTTGAAGRTACLGGDTGGGGGGVDSCFACSGFFKPPDRLTAIPLLGGGALLSNPEFATRSVAELGDLLRRWYAEPFPLERGVVGTISTCRLLRDCGSSSQPHSSSSSFSAVDL